MSFRTSVQRQSFTVEVCVIDKNDNVPTFIGESMRGSVQLGLLKGTWTLSCDVTALISLVWVVFVFLALLYPKIRYMPMCNMKLQFTLYVVTLLLLHLKKKKILNVTRLSSHIYSDAILKIGFNSINECPLVTNAYKLWLQNPQQKVIYSSFYVWFIFVMKKNIIWIEHVLLVLCLLSITWITSSCLQPTCHKCDFLRLSNN